MQIKTIITLFLLLIVCSCSLIKKKGAWGKHAFTVKGDRIVSAFKKNVASKHVWVPLIGAGVIHWGGYDKKISQRAVEEKIIFEDNDAADIWSNYFNNTLKFEMYLSSVLTPSMGEDEKWGEYLWSKTKGTLLVSTSSQFANYTHDRLAEMTKVRRPNEQDNRSFPSGHATKAGSWNRLTSKNLDYIEMPSDLRLGLNTFNTVLASGTLWARIEGKRHYPSDVLCGYALGAFVSGFLYDAFLNYDPSETLAIIPSKERVYAEYSIQF